MTSLFPDICVALATPPGQSGIALIRLSGQGAAQLVEPLFLPLAARFGSVSKMAGYTCAPGDLIDPQNGNVVDQVLLTRFCAPHSYTGEDVIEISCHGGNAVKQEILRLLLEQGAVAAQPGEFTKRAFLNGKLDLIQAEAVMDLISADAARSAQNAAALLKGQLSDRLKKNAAALYQLLAAFELIMEFPEHDETSSVQKGLQEEIALASQELAGLADSYSQGRILKEGLTVVLAGRPNAGKSSLLNALAGFDRAIVTAVPGTTRDTVEQIVDIQGIPVKLIDTAGLRESEDPVEQLGVARTKDALAAADLIFWLFSPPASDIEEDLTLLRQVKDKTIIPLLSKDDLDQSGPVLARLSRLWPKEELISCSALTGEGIEQLRQKILFLYESLSNGQDEGLLVSNSRQRNLLLEAVGRLTEASQALAEDLPLDIVALLLRSSLDSLAQITGDSVTDSLIETIFSRFCVGK